MRIESGVSKRALMSRGFAFALLAGFAAWFAWDGWVGYAADNLKQMRESLPGEPTGTLEASPTVTEESVAELQGQPRVDLTLAQLQQHWGEPVYLGPAAANAEADRVAWFIGPYGWAVATLTGDRVREIQWNDAKHDYSAIVVQRAITGILGAIALVPLALLLLDLSRKSVLDEEGLVLPGAGRIGYAQMTRLDDSDFTRRGIMRLHYVDARGQERTANLSEDRIDRFDDIVVALCKQKGWPVQLEEVEAGSGPTPPSQG